MWVEMSDKGEQRDHLQMFVFIYSRLLNVSGRFLFQSLSTSWLLLLWETSSPALVTDDDDDGFSEGI